MNTEEMNEELDRQMGMIIIKIRQDRELVLKEDGLYKNQKM